MSLRIGFLVSHPIQYYAPIFRALAQRCDLTVFFAHRQTAEGQAKAGYGVTFQWDVDLLSGYDSRTLANVSRQPSTDVFAGCDTPDIAQEIEKGGFDAFLVPGWGLKSYVRGDSQLASQRGGALRMAKAAVFPLFLRRFDGFLYVGQRNREYLQHYGVRADRLFFSPHCIDNQAFRSGSEAARAKSPRDPNRPARLLFVGKLVDSKRPFDVLEAAAKVQGRRVEVAFAGAGEAEGRLKQAAATAGVSTVFHGFVNQSELPAVYAAADVIVSPSVETWALVVNEAMACGLPAVVSDAVGCGPDLVEEGATGAIFRLGDAAGFARAIERVLAIDPARRQAAISAKMAVYSPRRTAEGIVDAAAVFTADHRQPGAGL
jgi:glycosyltransferase involved in cell wall biosynthesis